MQAIVTKYIGPTNHRGSRVKASAQAGTVTLGWDHALNPDNNHRAAALALMARFGWQEHSTLSEGGSLPNGTGECFVMTPKPWSP